MDLADQPSQVIATRPGMDLTTCRNWTVVAVIDRTNQSCTRTTGLEPVKRLRHSFERWNFDRGEALLRVDNPLHNLRHNVRSRITIQHVVDSQIVVVFSKRSLH